ncbi:MAG: GHKL domain-containing protein [Clostridia bacterium]|nr:GHKL domain-containing protein [Clostridia bacterium]
MTLFDRIFHKKIDERIEAYQRELIEKHCEEVQNIYNTMRGWRHDYKNHIAVMQAALKMNRLDELERYLGELTVDLNTVDTVVKTGNVMADAILNSKLALAKKRDIKIDATAALPEGVPLSDVELCVIIGNLLDNAMEACAEVEPPSDRFLRVYIGAFKRQLYISVTNAMRGAPDRRGKTYRTTKGEGHGFGLQRIDRVVKQYGGYINRQHEEGVFGTEIMIPLDG